MASATVTLRAPPLGNARPARRGSSRASSRSSCPDLTRVASASSTASPRVKGMHGTAPGTLSISRAAPASSNRKAGGLHRLSATAERSLGSVSLPGSSARYIIVGDIGGTNARLQIWSVTDVGSTDLVFEKIYPTKNFRTFKDVLKQLHSENEGIKVTTACFAVAGPVVDQVCHMTNLGWTIDREALMKEFGYEVGVLNDFEAVGYGVRFVDPEHVVVLNDVPPVPEAPIAVLGPGTGLGEAQLMWDDLQGAYRVYPSEGSHADFAPRGWKQRALAQYIESKLGYCEVESVGCGAGLERIYEFLASDEGSHSEPLLQVFMLSMEINESGPEGAHDPTKKQAPEISKAALEGTDPIALEAVDIMLSIVGAEAGHMALRSLARGGVYIAGGITPKVISRVNFGGLLNAFLNRKARFYDFLKTVPLYVVMDEKVGLLGSRMYCIQLLRKQIMQQQGH